MTVRVLLVDDQRFIRNAMRMILADVEDIEVAGEAETGAEAIRLTEDLCPDVVLMDIRMPGVDGMEATRQIIAGKSGSRVLVLTTFDDDAYIYGALQAGASGFLVKDMDLDEIVAAIRVVAAGNALVAPSVTRRLIERALRLPAPVAAPALDCLSDREREVLTLVGYGLNNAEIAQKVYLSVATVKSHISKLMQKLVARDRVHLVLLAHRAGLVEP
ncbi:response regulator transcription factor [Actinoplanes sp. NPDC051851]|uniref:response regulator transcription factor n=1 Tax=Actinoplanes sp. NPDC051851 TaxID=3154753 RepID=UPI0034333632